MQSFEWEQAFGDVRTWLAEQKAKIAEAEAGNLRADLSRAKWPKIAGTRWGTIYVDPESAKPADFGGPPRPPHNNRTTT